jgi:hypothetical protein
MDRESRNEWEHFCALAEIEEDPDKFLEIEGNVVRITRKRSCVGYGPPVDFTIRVRRRTLLNNDQAREMPRTSANRCTTCARELPWNRTTRNSRN